MKVFIVTQDEPFFIPRMIQYLSEHQSEGYEIVGITVLKPHMKNRTMKDWFLERYRVYSKRELFLAGSLYACAKLSDIVLHKVNRRYYSVKRFAREHNIRDIPVENVNSPTYIAEVQSLEPDLIVSISSPQIFGKKLLAIAKYGCINAHETLLPKHRGVFGTWWTLFDKDREGGTTIHEMALKIDAGRIIEQGKVDIDDDESQFSLAYKTKSLSAYLLEEVIKQYVEKRVIYKKMELSTGSYHYTPTREQAHVFRRKGLRIVTLKDIRTALGGSLFPKRYCQIVY